MTVRAVGPDADPTPGDDVATIALEVSGRQRPLSRSRARRLALAPRRALTGTRMSLQAILDLFTAHHRTAAVKTGIELERLHGDR